ncbi:ABC transporter permease [Planktomarina temperata]|nr:ABC transporter permease [Planktomarina temperata]
MSMMNSGYSDMQGPTVSKKQNKNPNPKAGPGLIRRMFQVDGASVALVFVILIVVFMIAAPKAFLGYRIYMSFMATVPPPLIIALGVTLVAVAGEMDLSFPSVVAAASYVFGILFQQWELTWFAMILAVSVGAIMGLINGMVITLLGIPSLIATLAMLFLWGGLVTVVSGGIQLAIPDIYGTPMHTILVGRIGDVFPAQMVWTILIAGFIWALLNRHRFGENLLFIGDSLEVAKVVGINVTREKIKLFALSGALSGLAGVLLTLETTAYFSSQGMGYLLTVIAAVFIGGTSIYGGSGRVIGTVFAAFIVTVIEAGLVASGIQGFWTRFSIGFVFIVSVTANAIIENPDNVPLVRMLRTKLRNN